MGGREWYIDLVFGVRYTVKLLDWKPFARHPPNRVSLMCIDAHLAERSSRVLEEEQERTRREAGIDAKFKYFYNFPRFSFFPLSFFKYVDDCVTGRGSLTFKITHRRSAVSHRSKGPAALPSSFYWVPIPFREIWGKKGNKNIKNGRLLPNRQVFSSWDVTGIIEIYQPTTISLSWQLSIFHRLNILLWYV